MIKLLFICFMSVSFIGVSQQKAKVDHLNNLFFDVYDQDLNKANKYATEALTISKKINYKKGEGGALYRKGIVFDIQMKADSARVYLLKGIQILKQTDAWEELGDAYNNLGAHYYYQFEYKKAIQVHEKAITYFQKANQPSGAARALNNIGICYKNLGDLKKALYTYKRSYQFGIEQKDSLTMSLALASISGIYEEKKAYKKALDYNLKSELWIPEHENYTRITILFTRGEILRKQGLLIESEKAYLDGMQIAKKTNNIERLQYFYKSLANLKKQQNQIETSFTYYQSYDSLRDEMYRRDKNEFIEAYEQKFKVADKEVQRLQAINAKRKIQQELFKNQRVLLFSSGIILLLIGFAFLAYRANRLKRKRIELVQERLEESEMFSKELHHRIKNNLQMVASLISMESRTMDPDLKIRLQGIIETLQVMSRIHESLYGTAKWESVSIPVLFESIQEQGKRLMPTITFETFGLKGNIDLDTGITLGILINEWITNSIKHAFHLQQTPIIRIGIEEQNSKMLLIYSDNGSGYHLNDNSLSEGFGTKMVSVLLRKINGHFSISTDNGMTIKVEFDNYTYHAIENSDNRR
jgi:two-component system, sensor histidine kinase PdtaS